MRSAIIAVAIGAGALYVGARLVGALGQLEAIGAGATSRAESVAAALPADESGRFDEPLPVSTDAAPIENGMRPRAAAVGGAARAAGVEALLIAEPDFQRAAAELMNDPDPEVRREGADLLREFGVAQ